MVVLEKPNSSAKTLVEGNNKLCGISLFKIHCLISLFVYVPQHWLIVIASPKRIPIFDSFRAFQLHISNSTFAAALELAKHGLIELEQN